MLLQRGGSGGHNLRGILRFILHVREQKVSPDSVSWSLPPGRKCAPRCALRPADLYPASESHPESRHTSAHKIPGHRLCLRKEPMMRLPVTVYSLGIYFNIQLSTMVNLHLLVSWARRTLSEENDSSRSNRSSMGGAKSHNAGGKTWKRVKNGVYDISRTVLEVSS